MLDGTKPFHSVALAQYRLSFHYLGIETGRHPKPPKPKEKRLCLYCRNGCVDDEIHFLTECDIHTEIRQRFVSNIKSHIEKYEELPANGKFVTVMTNSSEAAIKEVAICIQGFPKEIASCTVFVYSSLPFEWLCS